MKPLHAGDGTLEAVRFICLAVFDLGFDRHLPSLLSLYRL
jgi:hypothetical protein